MRHQLIKDAIALGAILLLLAVTFAARAHDEDAENWSGIYYDSTRSGEGLFVVHDSITKNLAFALFTHDPEETETLCVQSGSVVDLDGNIVSVGEEVCDEVLIDKRSAWYLAADTWDGSSGGILYECTAYDYPITIAQQLCEERAVGMYILDSVPGGLRLIITQTGGDVPETVFNWFFFNQALLKTRFKPDD
jgi:hypothetical protein